MQLIKDQTDTQDEWVYITDKTTLKANYNIVSLVRWENERDVLMQQGNHLGLRLESNINIANIVNDIVYFQLIELFIPVFTDGRVFSQARLLRSRYGFTGDIRVSGDFMIDQVFYLSRVGVSSFVLNDQENAQQVIQSMDAFSVNYQQSTA